MELFYLIMFGILGVIFRYYQGLFLSFHFGNIFPIGTFCINLTGAFCIGIISVIATERAQISKELRIGIMVGFLGGYTTFSAYCLETVHLVEGGDYFRAVLYFVISPTLGFLLTLGGILFARRFFTASEQTNEGSYAKLTGEQTLLRIFIDDAKKQQGKPLYLFIAEEAKKQGLAGCSVLPGSSGFGKSGQLHSDFPSDYAIKLPIIIELVDGGKRLNQFLKTMEPFLAGSLVTEEKLQVHHYRAPAIQNKRI